MNYKKQTTNNELRTTNYELRTSFNQNWTIMQNKPNLLDAQMDVSSVLTKDYENIANWTLGENKPKQSQWTKSQNGCKLSNNKEL